MNTARDILRGAATVAIVVIGGPPTIVITVLGSLAWIAMDWWEDQQRTRGNW